ncbi:hypothetical protein HII36_19870 [Nonomuraea sp. NN258]|uniref:hypothetical protein n=1 Tax=Nonomuraea antri TaxID=2730852 RepID=UPI001568D30C|nr:hypothetical protein [Nonomuraea antri]NRQ34093.1 hypothetical protein [Nonomuraea antri]
MKALIRFLLGDPTGHAADGRALGVGLSSALRKHYSADEADRYLREWAEKDDIHKSPRR